MQQQSEQAGIPALRFEALKRPRIFEQLTWSSSDLPPLTLLCGPVGSGKTVAAVQAVEALDPAILVRWVNASECVDNPERIWASLFGAVTGATADADFEQLAAAVESRAEPMLLVVDDWQCVTSVGRDSLLARLVEHRPQLSLLVISRQFSVLAGPAIAGRVSVQTAMTELLAFTAEEIAELTVAGQLVGAHRATLMRLATDGWPLAVQALVRSVASSDQLNKRHLTELMRAFATDLVAATSEHLSGSGEELLTTLVLCGPVAVPCLAEITRQSEAHIIQALGELEREGLVARCSGTGIALVRVHAAVCEVLKERARLELGESAVREVQLRAGQVIAKQDPVAGLRLLAEHRDFGAMQEVLASDFAVLLERRQESQDILNPIEFGELDDYPMLMAGRLILGYSDPATPQTTIESWHERLQASVRRRSNEHVPSPALLNALLCATERMAGNGAGALQIARDLERGVAEGGATKQGTSLPLLLHAVLAFTGLADGDYGMAERQYSLTVEHAERSGNVAEQLRGLSGLAVTAAIAGDITAAEHWLFKVDELSNSSGESTPELSWVNEKIARAFVALERWDAGGLHDVLERTGPWFTRMELWPMFAIAEAALVRLRHGEQGALLAMRARTIEAKAGFTGTTYLRTKLAAYILNLTMGSGDLNQTERDLGQLPSDHLDVVVARVRLKLVRRDFAGAIEAALTAQTLGPTPRLRGELFILIAVAEWQVGEREQAVESLAEGAEWNARHGLTSPFATVPHDWLNELAHAAREAGVIDIVNTLQQIPRATQVELTEPLTEAERRTLQVIARGGTIEETAVALFLSKNTVKFHLRGIYRKLRADDRIEAVNRASRLGLITSTS